MSLNKVTDNNDNNRCGGLSLTPDIYEYKSDTMNPMVEQSGEHLYHMHSIDVDDVDGAGLDDDNDNGTEYTLCSFASDGSIIARQQTTSLKLAERHEHVIAALSMNKTILIGDNDNENDTPKGIIGDQSILSRNRSLRSYDVKYES